MNITVIAVSVVLIMTCYFFLKPRDVIIACFALNIAYILVESTTWFDFMKL